MQEIAEREKTLIKGKSSNLRGCRGGNIIVDRLYIGVNISALKNAPPPRRWVQRSLAVVEGRIDVAEEVPNYPSTRQHAFRFNEPEEFNGDEIRTMSNNDTTNLILRHATM